ncbi:MAG: endopeptidase La, partial [Limisphaerales bacterium]
MKDQYSDAAQPTLLELLSDREGQAEPHVIGVTGSDRTDQVPIPETLPILVIRNLVVFPGTVVPLSIRRKSSRQLLDESLTHSKVIGLMTQKKADIEQPGPDDIYPVGVAALVLKMIRQPDETVLLVIQALQRISLRKIVQVHPYMRAEVQVLQSTAPANNNEFEAMFRNLRETAGKLVELSPDVPDQARVLIMNIEEPGQLADFVASTLPLDVTRKQQLLEQTDVAIRMRAVQESVNNQLQIAQIQQRLQDDVASHMSDNQRRAYLREQLKAIQRELGETGGAEEQVENLRTRLDEAAPPESVREQADRELKRLEYVPPASPEYSVIIGYLETIANLPWNKLSKDSLDLNQAQRILDRDHYDLQKVKRRLIEYLAVRKLNPEGRGPILCFLGPPGVGKTSLGQSIADALGRKFSRMSLGGIRDEAEIRGHRRTYIGAMPGRIIQELRRVGTRNPVIMLDEVDKIGADFRGDPAAALLEVLDPRQNNAFVDRFLDVPFDLSQIIFIATANYMDPVPPALRDRMEVIELPGYTEHEKLQIAMSYLVRRQLKENGLKPEQCEWTDEAIIRIVNDYTHEAGVRELERQIGAVCRAIAARIARDETTFVRVTPEIAAELLGPAKYIREQRLKTSKPGVVTGLAYTP